MICYLWYTCKITDDLVGLFDRISITFPKFQPEPKSGMDMAAGSEIR